MAKDLKNFPEIVGIGASPLDVFTLVDEFSCAEGVNRATEITFQGGGPVATALVTASQLGISTMMIDMLGDDWIGEQTMTGFQQAGVDTSGLVIAPGTRSPMATIQVRKRDGARNIHYLPGSAPPMQLDDHHLQSITSAKILHLNGRHLEASLEAVAAAREHGVSVSFDGGAGRYREDLLPMLQTADILIVTREFSAAFTGENSPGKALVTMGSLSGAHTCGVTDGSTGSWFWESSDGRVIFQPAFPQKKCVDTTGCGDVFHGAFLAALLRGATVDSCALLASRAASWNTRALGGRGCLPTWAELQHNIDNPEVSEFSEK